MKTPGNETELVQMPPELLAEARRAADEEHRPADELVSDAVRHYLENRRQQHTKEQAATPQAQSKTDERPIWEVITDILKDVPDEVFDRLPKDGASQVDHYIYGLPKRA